MNLVIAGGLAILLLATCAWCAVVDRRLRRLRLERGELMEFVTALNTASARAEAAIAGLRGATSAVEKELSSRTEEASRRAADLARLLEAASRVLRRLEQGVHQGVRSAAELPGSRPEAGHEPRLRDAPLRRPTTRAAEGLADTERETLRRALESLR